MPGVMLVLVQPLEISETMFDYSQESPLNFQELGVEARGGANIHDISYTNPNASSVSAYLVIPRKGGRFAGAIFLHGGDQDRSAFLDEALSLAGIGAVSLLIDEPSVRAMPLFADPEADRERYVQVILKLRRGVDVLLSRADVDQKRIGYVGLSFGAWMGGVLSGVENRVKSYVLIAGLPSMTSFWRRHQHPVVAQIRESLTAEQMENYLRITAPLDAIHYISRATPASLFFQFGRQDELILEPGALEYSRAASEPKKVEWYDAGHHDIFINKAARDNRIEWLQKEIELGFS
jgi:cephalosporin-C deacetylase-like acetyl esterase